jgi:hypothetical protein
MRTSARRAAFREWIAMKLQRQVIGVEKQKMRTQREVELRVGKGKLRQALAR